RLRGGGRLLRDVRGAHTGQQHPPRQSDPRGGHQGRMKRMQTLPIVGLCLFAALAAFVIVTRGGPIDWRNASREPVGLAPEPADTPEAVVQVYAARTWGWRGYFGVHTWVAVKPARAKTYTVYEVI